VYPGGDGGGNGVVDNACSEANEWSSSTRYAVGDSVTYQGNLYERDFTGWNFIKNCG